jgi:hypothetical protein
MFTKNFDDYACEGDKISCEKDGFTIEARIIRDDCSDAPDQRANGFWPSLDPKVAGWIGDKPRAEYDRQLKRAQEVMQAWKDDEWFYCGIVLSVSKNGVMLDNHAASLWGIDCNYPKNPDEKRPDMPGSFPNYYLREVANELLDDAIAAGKTILQKLV